MQFNYLIDKENRKLLIFEGAEPMALFSIFYYLLKSNEEIIK